MSTSLYMPFPSATAQQRHAEEQGKGWLRPGVEGASSLAARHREASTGRALDSELGPVPDVPIGPGTSAGPPGPLWTGRRSRLRPGGLSKTGSCHSLFLSPITLPGKAMAPGEG